MVIFKYPDTILLTINWGTPPYKIYFNEDLIAENVIDNVYEFKDIKISNLPIYPVLFKVEDSTGQVRTQQVFLDKRFRGQVKEILRREHIWMKNFSGELAYVLKRRKTGVHCPRCYDDAFNSAADPKCPICFGTKFVSGFYLPVETYALFAPPENLEQQAIQQPIQIIKQNFVVGPETKIDVDDYIFLPNYHKKLYRIIGYNIVEYHGVLIKQLVSSTELTSQAIEYKAVENLDWLFYNDVLPDKDARKLIYAQTGFNNFQVIDEQIYLTVGSPEKVYTVTLPNVSIGFSIKALSYLNNHNLQYSTDNGVTWIDYPNNLTHVAFTGNNVDIKVKISLANNAEADEINTLLIGWE